MSANTVSFEDRVALARIGASLKSAFWQVAILGVPCRSIALPPWSAGAATDGRGIMLDPAKLGSASVVELESYIAHEAVHILLDHVPRRGSRDPIRWNYCADQRVNQVLLANNIPVPDHWVPPDLTDSSVEELYCKMPDMGAPALCQGLVDLVESEGGAAGAEPLPADFGKQLLKRALEAAKQAGTLPAGLDCWIAELLAPPRIPLAQIVAAWSQARAQEERSLMRPRKRYIPAGIMLPGPWRTYPSFAMAVDTSGSMSDAQIADACSDVRAGVAAAGGALTVLWADADVYPQEVAEGEPFAPKGRGGTSYAPVMRWLIEEPNDFLGLIYITDGYCDDFGDEPLCDVVWVVVTDTAFEPPFGEVIRV